MGSIFSRVIAIAAIVVLAGCNTPTNTTAENAALDSHFQASVIFNDHWEFFKDDSVLTLTQAKANQQWQPVSLPHTPQLEPKVVNDQWQGDAWYKKSFTWQQSWKGKKILLDFEGAMNFSEVWINNKKMAEHHGGYLPFTVDLTNSLAKGDNTLFVRLDNRDNPVTGPKPLEILDFNTYGGLYRNVWLRVENTTHITNAVAAGEVASGGIFVTFPRVDKQQSTIAVQTHIAHSVTATPLRVEQRLFDNGNVVAESVKEVADTTGQSSTFSQLLTVKKPQLWSPNSPYLYQLETHLFEGDVLVDKELTSIGIREFKFDAGHLYINGEETFLRGVNRHQEYPYVGYALSDAAQYRDAEKIKAAGFDYVRLSHYPHSSAFLHAADELGLVLVDAILGWQYVTEKPEFLAHVVQTCRDMIRRDRNHASVLAWECSLNESWMQEPLIDQFQQAVHEEYPGSQVYSAGWQEYGYDIYLQARQHRLEHYKAPTKPYVVSEYGDWEYYAMNAGLNQDSWGELKQADRSSRQLLNDGEKRLQQQALNISEAHNDNFNTPAFADGYWVMFDYNRGYADDLEASGIMSIDRLPKFSYYFYQSQRDADQFAGPLVGGYMAFIASHWQKNSSLSFDVYSNAETIELLLNGKSIATALPNKTLYPHLAHAPFRFNLDKFTPGTLTAKAMVKGKVVAEHSVTTPSAPKTIELSVERSSIKPQIQANDVVFIYAQVVDANGVNSRVNGNQIEFSVTGGAQLLSPVNVMSEDGVASALIRVGNTRDPIRVKASGDNLSAAELLFSL